MPQAGEKQTFAINQFYAVPQARDDNRAIKYGLQPVENFSPKKRDTWLKLAIIK